MVILQALIARTRTYYFRGSATGFEWSTDRSEAAQYPNEAAARADLVGSPMAYDHYAMRAQVVPA